MLFYQRNPPSSDFVFYSNDHLLTFVHVIQIRQQFGVVVTAFLTSSKLLHAGPG